MALQTSPHGCNPPRSLGKPRRRTSPQALATLESSYAENPLPDKQTRTQLCDSLGWDPRAVQVWFQNRRQREKREKETEAYYARSTAGSRYREEDNKENYAPFVQHPTAAGPARSSPLLRGPPSTMMMMPPPPFTARAELPAKEVWRLMISSPERAADAQSSSPVKADVRPTSTLKRSVSLDVMASRPQQVFGHLGDVSSTVPSLCHSIPGESSEGGSETDELVTPDSSTFSPMSVPKSAIEMDAQDREAASLLMQLFAARP